MRISSFALFNPVVANELEYIGDYAFCNSSIKKFSAKGNYYIWDSAFRNCKNLETIILDYYLEAGLFKKYSYVDKLNDFNRISGATNIEQFTPIPAHLECKKLFGFGLLDSMYSGEKIPYSDAFDIDCSGVKYRKIWNSYDQQFKQDTFEDSLEILKLIHKTGDYALVDDYIQYLRDMDYDYRYAIKPLQVRSASYYADFRPKLLSLIESEQK